MLIVSLLSSITYSQGPSFYATQNWLTKVSHNACMQKAKETLLKNGFSANPQADNVSYMGTKTGSTAYVTCQSCQEKVIVTIVVSSSDNNVARESVGKMLDYIANSGEVGTGTVTLQTNKSLYTNKEKIVVEYSGMAGFAQDWITLTKKGSAATEYGPWKYTEGKKSGSMIFEPLSPGEYEARAYFNNQYVVQKTVSFKVIADDGGGGVSVSKNLRLSKSSFAVGEKITVQFFGLAGNSTDWITITKAGLPENQYGQWMYTSGKKDGEMSFNGLDAGSYEVRLYLNNSYKIEDRLAIKVAPPSGGDFIIRTDKTVFSEKEPIKVYFSNLQGTNVDWVSICQAGKPDTEYGQWFYRGALSAGELTFTGLGAGNYEVRYYMNNGYAVKKRISIQVVK